LSNPENIKPAGRGKSPGVLLVEISSVDPAVGEKLFILTANEYEITLGTSDFVAV
jgi:hypothetical protein